MKKSEAAQLVNQTFNQAFSEKQFINFVKNLLPGLKPPSSHLVTGAQLKQGFQEHIHSYKRLGTFHDPLGDVLDVVVVKLKRPESLDRARTRQRNLMAHYLKDRQKDAVLVAYITEDPTDWRFSFVKLAYQTEITEKGIIKPKQVFTPARRYSFLVGEHEPNHTAQKQLGDLLMLEGNLTLDQIEEAFNIESVTKEFFEKYKSLFLQIKENMDQIVDSNQKVKDEFERCAIDTANFSKKLLGQIVFLYFLQKKGWLGVAIDEAWGTGDKKFLYNLYEKNRDQNFFDDILEPFFYEALAIERKGDYYPALASKVPFLNGGLFEPLHGYDWENTHINLGNKVFEEVFKVFNLYNFTVREDEPLEKEVAVDPEMLGKVFENLLEIKDRKSKGAYYTPREIVHFMCQESLINYLDAALNEESQKVAKEDIESFIREGDVSIERDQAREEGKLQGNEYGLPKSIREQAKDIDCILGDIKIADPAIGSGAFPVGMMTEIVRARLVMTPYLVKSRHRDPYTFKWHCIENSLYGVDIDPSAVEIAKLRLWLSLVVDEESYDQIRPLPNLDYKIVCGNSLMGVDVKDKFFHWKKFQTLEQKKIQYFGVTSHRNKEVLREEIDGLIDQLTDGKQIFDFEVYFSEVFSGKGGFDIVIGNPPYIGERKNKEVFIPIQNGKLGKYYLGRMDYFYFFFHLAIDISKQGSIISLITTNYFPTALGAKKLRSDIKNRTTILKLINFNELKIFNSASGQHNMISILKNGLDSSCLATTIVRKAGGVADDDLLRDILVGHDEYSEVFNIPQEFLWGTLEDYLRISGNLSYSGNPLQPIMAKLVEAERSLPLGTLCNTLIGLESSLDKVYIIYENHINEIIDKEDELSLLKPFFKNSDIYKYVASKENTRYILYLHEGIKNIQNFSGIWRYLNKNKQAISTRKGANLRGAYRRGNWWVLNTPRLDMDFEGAKLITPYRTKSPRFAYSDTPWYASRDVYFITTKDPEISLKYILALLNSDLYFLWLLSKGKRKGGMMELYSKPLSEIPVRKISKADQIPFIEAIDKIIKLKRDNKEADITAIEELINDLVYQLYGLTEEEIEIVEESVGR